MNEKLEQDDPDDRSQTMINIPFYEQPTFQAAPSRMSIGKQSFVDKMYDTPASLDLFTLETRARKTIAELIKPIQIEADTDRSKVAKMTVKHDNVLKRLTKIEFILNLNSQKPKVFEDIDNAIAAIKSDIAINKSEAEFQVDLSNTKNLALE